MVICWLSRKRCRVFLFLVPAFVSAMVALLSTNSIVFYSASYELQLTHMTTNSSSTTPLDRLKEDEEEDWIPNASLFTECMTRNRVVGRFFMSNSAKMDYPYPEERPYSLRVQDFHRQPGIKACSTLQETLAAIRFGQRHWEVDHHPHQEQPVEYELPILNNWTVRRDRLHSNFVPHGCHVRLVSPKQVCEELNLYSHIYLLGDSFSRHIQGGLVTAITNDFVFGTLWSSPGGNTTMENCRCDGQFSERGYCRRMPANFSFIRPDAAALDGRMKNDASICSHLKPKETTTSIFEEYFADLSNQSWYNHCGSHTRGILLSLQGGLHSKLNATDFIQKVLHPIFANARFKECVSHNNVYIIWNAHGYQSPQIDKIYAHQDEKHADLFNHNVGVYLDMISNHTIAKIDFVNLTMGAQVSDGVHFLTSVNFFKAQYILQVAKLMKAERQYMTLVS